MGWFRNLGGDRPWAQGRVIAGAGLVLAGTGCFGFLMTIDAKSANSKLGGVFTTAAGIVFGLSALAILVGFIWFIVGLVKNVNRNPQPPPPTASPAE